MDPKFRQQLFGGGAGLQLGSADQQKQQDSSQRQAAAFVQQQQFQQMQMQPEQDAMEFQQQMQSQQQPVMQMSSSQQQQQQASSQSDEPLSRENQQFLSGLSQILNLSDLPNSLSFTMTAGGVVFNKKSTKIDQEGSYDLVTGERNQHILMTDIEYGEILGQGNGGMVRAGILKVTGIPVAVKIINLFDKEKRHQFYNEFDMIKNSFPLLVHYYGAFFHEGQIHLVMEYMDCGSLETMIAVEKESQSEEEKRSKPLIPELVISRFAWHLLQALRFMHHECKQIHRDLKPDNILIESNLGLAKLSDFGISKQLSRGQQSEEHTRTYTGTLCYMSPERLQGMEYSYPSDIWSLGVVIYEMATGQHPYPRTDRPIQFHQTMITSPAPSLVGSTRVSIELANFVDKCLQKDPSKRAKAYELLEDPFITFFLQFDNEDHISWLKEFRERQIAIKEMHAKQQVDLSALGIESGLSGQMQVDF